MDILSTLDKMGYVPPTKEPSSSHGDILSTLDKLGYSPDLNKVPQSTPLTPNPASPQLTQAQVEQMAQDARPTVSSVVNAGLQGGKEGIQGIGQGLGQLAGNIGKVGMQVGNAAGLVDDAALQKYKDEQIAREQAMVAANPSTSGNIGRTTGNILGTLGLAVPAGLTGAGAVVANSAIGGLGGAIQPAANTEEQLKNTAIGTVLGGAISAIGEGISKLVQSKQALQVIAQPQKLREMAEGMIDAKASGANIADTFVDHLTNIKANLTTEKNVLYDKFAQSAQATGDSVPLAAFSSRIADAKKALTGNLPIDVLSSDTKSVLNRLAAYDPLVQQGAVAPLDLAKLRANINADIIKLDNGPGKTALTSLVGGLDRDLQGFADAHGSELSKQLQDANKFYKESYLPVAQNKLISKLTAPNATTNPQMMDNVFKTFVKNNSPETYNVLQPSEEINQATSSKILTDALNKATNDAGEFTPKTFLTQVNKYGSTNDVIMSPKVQEQLKGFATLLKTMETKTNSVGASIGSYALGKVVGAPAQKLITQKGAGLLYNALASSAAGKIFEKAAQVIPNSDAAKRLSLTAISAYANSGRKEQDLQQVYNEGLKNINLNSEKDSSDE